ncbi:hypothetical protein [Streptococcus dentiloxodontae]
MLTENRKAGFTGSIIIGGITVLLGLVFLTCAILTRSSEVRLGYIVGPVLAGIGLLHIVSGFVQKRHNDYLHGDIFSIYPELVGNLQTARDNASYWDDNLRFFVYRHHLMAYCNGFFAVDLANATKIYHQIFQPHNTKGVPEKAHSFLVITDNVGKDKHVTINNIGQITEEDLQSFFNYLQGHYPAIQVGYEK